MKFVDFIKNLKSKISKDRQAEVRQKWNAVKSALIKKYEAEQKKQGSIELPPFILADQEMEKIKTRKALDRYYEKYVKKSRV